MLCANGFTLVDSYYQSAFSYSSGDHIEYALNSDHIDASTKNGIYTRTACHIDIWKENAAPSRWRMEVSDDLEYCDMGIRSGMSSGDVHTSDGLIGMSAESGLSYQSGTYTTDDGRLSATVSEADVLVSSEHMRADTKVAYEIPNAYRLSIDGVGDRDIELVWGKSDLAQGDVLDYSDVESNDDLTFLLKTGEASQSIRIKGSLCFESLILRVLYYDTDSDAVFYLYAEPFSGDAIEMLFAADLKSVVSESGSSGSSSSSGVVSSDSNWDKSVLDCLTCHGSGNCTKCNGYGFLYTYTYVDGARAQIKKTCSSCHGSMDCRTCGGTGKR